LGEIYQLTFEDDKWLDDLTPDYQWGSTRGSFCINLTTGDTLFNQVYDNTYDYLENAPGKIEERIFEGINFDLSFPINTDVDKDKGIKIIKYNKNGRETTDWRKWSNETNTNISVKDITVAGSAYALPRDFELRVSDHVVDTSYAPPPIDSPYYKPSLFEYPINFAVYDVTDPNNQKKMKITVAYDMKRENPSDILEGMGQIWDSTRVIIRFLKSEKYNTGSDPMWASYQMEFWRSEFHKEETIIAPSAGDIFKIRTERNPTEIDTFRFKADGGQWLASDVDTKGERKVYVVPDPYVGANTLESIYELAGNSQRRIDFVNLPPKCTIYIFTASGELVKKIYHEANVDYGREPWDLTAEDGPEIAFGMYFFVMEAEGLDTQRGKFAIIK